MRISKAQDLKLGASGSRIMAKEEQQFPVFEHKKKTPTEKHTKIV